MRAWDLIGPQPPSEKPIPKVGRGSKKSLRSSGSVSSSVPSCGALSGPHCLFCKASCHGSHSLWSPASIPILDLFFSPLPNLGSWEPASTRAMLGLRTTSKCILTSKAHAEGQLPGFAVSSSHSPFSERLKLCLAILYTLTLKNKMQKQNLFWHNK